jgi:hypothetical protein
MANREGGIVANIRLFVPVNKKDTRNQIAVSQALLDAEEGRGMEGLMSIPGVRLVKVLDHRYTSVEIPAAPAAPTPEEVAAASAGQAGEVTVETVQPVPEEPQETSHQSTGEDQFEATEEAATGRRRSRAA